MNMMIKGVINYLVFLLRLLDLSTALDFKKGVDEDGRKERYRD